MGQSPNQTHSSIHRLSLQAKKRERIRSLGKLIIAGLGNEETNTFLNDPCVALNLLTICQVLFCRSDSSGHHMKRALDDPVPITVEQGIQTRIEFRGRYIP